MAFGRVRVAQDGAQAIRPDFQFGVVGFAMLQEGVGERAQGTGGEPPLGHGGTGDAVIRRDAGLHGGAGRAERHALQAALGSIGGDSVGDDGRQVDLAQEVAGEVDEVGGLFDDRAAGATAIPEGGGEDEGVGGGVAAVEDAGRPAGLRGLLQMLPQLIDHIQVAQHVADGDDQRVAGSRSGGGELRGDCGHLLWLSDRKRFLDEHVDAAPGAGCLNGVGAIESAMGAWGQADDDGVQIRGIEHVLPMAKEATGGVDAGVGSVLAQV